jgi:hypothetical protein
MISRRPLIPAVVAAAAALAPAAAAQSPPPTLTWDRGCYTDDQPMTFSGSGYTPGGPVDLVFSRVGGTVLGTYQATADAGGAVDDYVLARADGMLADDRDREQIGASAGDRTRAGQGEPPQSTTAVTTFTFTRWMGFSPGRYVPGRKAAVEIYGWAFAEGKRAYFQFRKGRRTVASVPLGRIAGPCGDLKARVKVPERLKPGAYRLVLSTGRRTLSDRYTWRDGRVVKRASASISAGRAPMRRAGH